MTSSQSVSVLLFEDEKAGNFHPLTSTRPVDDLRIGILTLHEKWSAALSPSVITRNLRANLRGVFINPTPDPVTDCLVINSRLIPTDALVRQVRSLEPGNGLTSGNTFLAGRISGDIARKWMTDFPDDITSRFKTREFQDIDIIDKLWNLFKKNGMEIRRDLALLNPENRHPSAKISSSAILDHKEDIFIGKNVVIEAGVILTATDGPIYIGDNATLMAGSIIRGPAAICEGATVRMGAKIYNNTTIGPVCKVGGEVNNVIFHSYSNKAHDGYAGNSVFGQWCNLGADSNTSNLKTNYTTVKFTDWNTGAEEDTGELFFGTVMGDHCKTGINAMLNTGTNCGVCCNLFSDGYPPKFVPSFSWISSDKIETYKFDKAVVTMERTMARRGVTISRNYIRMMKEIAMTPDT